MRNLIHVSLLAVALPAAAYASIERTVEKSFPVSEAQRLKLESFNGSIEIESSNDPVVAIKLVEKIDASSDEKADELLSHMELTFNNDSAGVTIIAKNQSKNSTGWFSRLFDHWGDNGIQLKWHIIVPASFNLELGTSGGSISVSDLKGTVKADTSGGSINLANIDGDVKADTSGGSITLKSGTGKAVLDTSGGSIRVGTCKGPLKADTSGGSISIAHAENTVHADTSGGGIDVAIFGPIKTSDLDTSGGGIKIRVDSDASFDFRGDTSGGSVRCELPIEIHGKAESDHLEGKVNGGGALLKADTSGGGIQVVKN
jgi:DUF4097 and DUF4098 domain-containing protein YvlB